MTDEDNVSFFERRLAEAHQLATDAADQHVRNIHVEMAAKYTLLAEQAYEAHVDPEAIG